MRYELFGITPETGQWRWGKERSLRAIENHQEMLQELGKTGEPTQEEIDAWYLKKLDETGEDLDLLRLSSTGKPEHYVPPSNTKLASSLWSDLKPNGNNQLKRLFGKKVFDNPKSVDLIKRLISFIEGNGSSKGSAILDSFSGSGTTGHAVMDLNEEDGGNRKFILVQMTEATEKEPDKNICKDITRERIKRAIEKYGYDSGFQYLRVGQPLDAETLLEGKLPDYKTFARYVYYLCTGENLKDEKKISEKKFFVGDFGNQAIYLIYKQDYEALTRMALNLEVAERISAEQPNKKRIVYAPACFLDEEYMEFNQIEFVSIPYNLFQRKG
jgi:adenine-specific DNA-methyltransferase